MVFNKLKYALARPLLQFLANLHWYRRGNKMTLRMLCDYAGLSENMLSPQVLELLDHKVVALTKAGGGYILKHSLAFNVLYYDKVEEAFRQGALAVVTNKQVADYPCIVVENPMFVYAQMANYYRSLQLAPATAVVGSIGKTTTKLMLGSAYSTSFKTLCENGNFTNITRVLQLCQHLNPEYKQLIFEISEANYGTIEAASIALAPKVAVITAIDYSHMEEFGDAEEIKRQVCSIARHMPADGAVIVNKDEFSSYEYLYGRKVLTVSLIGEADFVSSNIIVDSEGISFDLKDNINHINRKVNLPNVWGKHNVGMALQAYGASVYLGMNPDKIIKGLSRYRPQGIRQNAYKTLNGQIVYADCFNAVAKSISSAIDAAKSIPNSSGRKIAVLADVEEAGVVSDQLHREIIDLVNKSGFNTAIVYGPKLTKALDSYDLPLNLKIIKCSSFSLVMKAIRVNIKRGDLILFKASHSWHLDRCIKRLWPLSFYWKALKERIPFLLWRIGIEFY